MTTASGPPAPAPPDQPGDTGRTRVIAVEQDEPAEGWIGRPALLTAIGVGTVVAIALLAAAAGRPVQVDEPLVTGPALRALDGDLSGFDFAYPPLMGLLTAVGLWIVGAESAVDPAGIAAGRAISAVATGATIAGAGILAAGLTHRRVQALAAAAGALATASAYLVVRFASIAKPDALQTAMIVAAVAAGVWVLHRPTRRRVITAGLLVGLAAAAKYGGGLVALPLLVALVVGTGGPRHRRVRVGAALTGSAVVGFVVGTAGLPLFRPRAFVTDIVTELTHQADGHLGYEADTGGLAFHLLVSLPGTWGTPLAVVAGAAVIWAAVAGDVRHRLVAAAAVVLLLAAAASAVRFPHYVLGVVPLAAALVGAGAARVAQVAGSSTGPRRVVPWVVGVVVVLLCVPPALDSLRYVVTWDAVDTRDLVTALDLPDAPMWVEVHSGRWPEVERPLGTVAQAGEELEGCGCLLATSSYQEERYRRLPEVYAEEVAAYDRLRAGPEPIAVIAPSVPLSYRWDGLPTWGVGDLSLTSPPERIGPRIEVWDLRDGFGS